MTMQDFGKWVRMDIADAITTVDTEPTPAWLEKAWANKPDQGEVVVDGARLQHLVWNRDRPDLPDLVLVHGFRAHAQWWAHIAPFLADNFRVFAIEMSGMGDSDRRAQYSRMIYANDVAGTVKALKLRRPRVVAHSFGGLATYIAASQEPELFSHAIFVDSMLGAARKSGPIKLPPIKKRFYQDRQEAISRFRLIPMGEWPNPHIFVHIGEHSVCQTADGWTWKYDADVPNKLAYDDLSKIEKITIPTGFIYGDSSDIITSEVLEEALEMLSMQHAPVVIPAANHHILMEQPLALISALRALFSATSVAKNCG
jgi:pimeloyl-ACP methyl ester carboxylesterase